jgi:hypothetical protein
MSEEDVIMGRVNGIYVPLYITTTPENTYLIAINQFSVY